MLKNNFMCMIVYTKHRLLYKRTMNGKSSSIKRTTTQCKIKVNNCKLIDVIIRIELTQAMILNFSEKFDHPFSHVFIFANMFPESHGFVVMPVTSSIKNTC